MTSGNLDHILEKLSEEIAENAETFIHHMHVPLHRLAESTLDLDDDGSISDTIPDMLASTIEFISDILG